MNKIDNLNNTSPQNSGKEGQLFTSFRKRISDIFSLKRSRLDSGYIEKVETLTPNEVNLGIYTTEINTASNKKIVSLKLPEDLSFSLDSEYIYFYKDGSLFSKVNKQIFENFLNHKIELGKIYKNTDNIDLNSKISEDGKYIYIYNNGQRIGSVVNISNRKDKSFGGIVLDGFSTDLKKKYHSTSSSITTEFSSNPKNSNASRTIISAQAKSNSTAKGYATTNIINDGDEGGWDDIEIGAISYGQDKILDISGRNSSREKGKKRLSDYSDIVFIDKEGNYYGPENKRKEFMALLEGKDKSGIGCDDKGISIDATDFLLLEKDELGVSNEESILNEISTDGDEEIIDLDEVVSPEEVLPIGEEEIIELDEEIISEDKLLIGDEEITNEGLPISGEDSYMKDVELIEINPDWLNEQNEGLQELDIGGELGLNKESLRESDIGLDIDKIAEGDLNKEFYPNDNIFLQGDLDIPKKDTEDIPEIIEMDPEWIIREVEKVGHNGMQNLSHDNTITLESNKYEGGGLSEKKPVNPTGITEDDEGLLDSMGVNLNLFGGDNIGVNKSKKITLTFLDAKGQPDANNIQNIVINEVQREPVELNATLADTRQMTRIFIEKEAKRIYQDKLHHSSFLKRIGLRFIKERYLKGITKKINKENRGVIVNNFSQVKNIAADRMSKDRNKFLDTTINNLGDWVNQEINKISEEYIDGKISSEIDFWDKFNQIVLSEKNSKIRKKITKLEHKGSNILQLLNIEKAYRILLDNVKQVLDSNSHDKDWDICELFKKFANTPEKLLFFMENSGINLDEDSYKNPNPNDDEFEERAVNYLKNVCHNIRDISVKFEILDSGKGAFQILHNDRKKGIQYKIGKTIDNHPIVSILGVSLGLFLTGIISTNSTHPAFLDSELVNYILSTTRISSLSTLAFGSLGFGCLNYLKSFANFTDRQEEFEQNKVFMRKDSLQDELDLIKTKLNNLSDGKKSFFRKKILKWKESNINKKLSIFEGEKINGTIINEVTNSDYVNIDSIINDFKEILANHMTVNEVDEYGLKNLLTQAIVRIEIWKKTGHNYFSCPNDISVEYKLQELYNLIIVGLNKLGLSYANFIKTNGSYLDLQEQLLKKHQYNHKNFTKIRRRESVKKGAISAGLFAISNSLSQHFAHSTEIINKGTSSITSVKTNFSVDNDSVMSLLKNNGIDLTDRTAVTNFLFNIGYVISGDEIYNSVLSNVPNSNIHNLATSKVKSVQQVTSSISDQLHSILGNKYNEFLAGIKGDSNNYALWDILTKDVFGNIKTGTEIKNKILEIMLDGNNNQLFNNLVNEATKNGLFDALNDKRQVSKLCKKLTGWGYNIKHDWVVNNISAIQSGSINLSQMNIFEKRKLAELLWAHIPNTTSGKEFIYNIFFATKNTIITEGALGNIKPLSSVGDVKTFTMEKIGNIIQQNTIHVIPGISLGVEEKASSSLLKYFGIPWLSKKKKKPQYKKFVL